MWMFRVQDRTTGKVVPVRFEGPISAMLDQGDVVHVEGYMEGGVLNARKITDENGALLAKSRCFVATAVYGDVMAPEVEVFRRFREQVLNRSALGRLFVRVYWRYGPRLAKWMEENAVACIGGRFVLNRIAGICGIWLGRKQSSDDRQMPEETQTWH
jgi:hypothetical protein